MSVTTKTDIDLDVLNATDSFASDSPNPGLPRRLVEGSMGTIFTEEDSWVIAINTVQAVRLVNLVSSER